MALPYTWGETASVGVITNHLSETHVSLSGSLEAPKLLALKLSSSYFVTSPCPDVLKPSVLSAIFVPLLAIQYALIRAGMIPDELIPQRLSPRKEKKRKERIPSPPARADINFSSWPQTVIFGEVERGGHGTRSPNLGQERKAAGAPVVFPVANDSVLRW